jgi:hypothetical protein
MQQQSPYAKEDQGVPNMIIKGGEAGEGMGSMEVRLGMGSMEVRLGMGGKVFQNKWENENLR